MNCKWITEIYEQIKDFEMLWEATKEDMTRF